MEHKQPIHDIYLDMVTTGVLEDRTEYDWNDLREAYDLTDQETDDLLKLVKDPDVGDVTNRCVEKRYEQTTGEAIKLIEKYADPTTAEYFVEGNHSGWDGWTQEMMPSVLSVIHDLALWLDSHPNNENKKLED